MCIESLLAGVQGGTSTRSIDSPDRAARIAAAAADMGNTDVEIGHSGGHDICVGTNGTSCDDREQICRSLPKTAAHSTMTAVDSILSTDPAIRELQEMNGGMVTATRTKSRDGTMVRTGVGGVMATGAS